MGEHGVSDTEEGADVDEPAHEAAAREDWLLRSAGPNPRASFSAIRHRTSTLSGNRQSQGSREPFAFGELVRISVVAVTQRVEYFVECEVKDTVADARDWGGVTLALELVQTAIRSRANSSMARLEENSSDGRTHSRSGSGLDAVLSSNGSSNENNTFGHPPGTELFEYD